MAWEPGAHGRTGSHRRVSGWAGRARPYGAQTPALQWVSPRKEATVYKHTSVRPSPPSDRVAGLQPAPWTQNRSRLRAGLPAGGGLAFCPGSPCDLDEPCLGGSWGALGSGQGSRGPRCSPDARRSLWGLQELRGRQHPLPQPLLLAGKVCLELIRVGAPAFCTP